jgi:hypothetical protein
MRNGECSLLSTFAVPFLFARTVQQTPVADDLDHEDTCSEIADKSETLSLVGPQPVVRIAQKRGTPRASAAEIDFSEFIGLGLSRWFK